MTKNLIIAILLLSTVWLAYWNFTADYTMSQKQVQQFCTAKPLYKNGDVKGFLMPDCTVYDINKIPTVYYNKSVQEDDLYIQPSDLGKVDLKPMPY